MKINCGRKAAVHSQLSDDWLKYLVLMWSYVEINHLVWISILALRLPYVFLLFQVCLCAWGIDVQCQSSN